MRTWQQITRKKFGANRDAESRELDRCVGGVRFPTKFWDGQPHQVSGSCANGGLDESIPTNPATHASVQRVTPFAYASGDFWLAARRTWHKIGGYIEAGVIEGGKSTFSMSTWGLDGFSLCRALAGAGVPQTTTTNSSTISACQKDRQLERVLERLAILRLVVGSSGMVIELGPSL